MGRRIRQRSDDLQLLDDGSRPTVRDDDRQSVRVLRADVNEMDVEPIDRGDELRQGVQPRLHLAPVVAALPIASQRLHRGQLHALRSILHGLPLRPACRSQTALEIGECVLRKVDVKRTNRLVATSAGAFAECLADALAAGVVCAWLLATGIRSATNAVSEVQIDLL